MKKIGVLFVLVCNLLLVSLVSAQNGGELSLEEQKRIIEANYDGGIVHEAIVMDEETLIFYDGKEWQELSALWGFNNEPIPWGEVYSFDNPEDIAKLKEISAQESEKVRLIESKSEKYPEMKFIQFYPDNKSWEFQDDFNKDAYATFQLSGFIIINNNNKILVLSTTTIPSRSLLLFQDGTTGSFSTMQISNGDGLAPSLIGITPNNQFEIDSTGYSPLYQWDLKSSDVENWLGGDEINTENLETLISSLEKDKKTTFNFAFQTGTIADKE